MTLHDFVEAGGWAPPADYDRLRSLTEVRDFVVAITDYGIWQVRDAHGDQKFVVELVHRL